MSLCVTTFLSHLQLIEKLHRNHAWEWHQVILLWPLQWTFVGFSICPASIPGLDMTSVERWPKTKDRNADMSSRDMKWKTCRAG